MSLYNHIYGSDFYVPYLRFVPKIENEIATFLDLVRGKQVIGLSDSLFALGADDESGRFYWAFHLIRSIPDTCSQSLFLVAEEYAEKKFGPAQRILFTPDMCRMYYIPPKMAAKWKREITVNELLRVFWNLPTTDNFVRMITIELNLRAPTTPVSRLCYLFHILRQYMSISHIESIISIFITKNGILPDTTEWITLSYRKAINEFSLKQTKSSTSPSKGLTRYILTEGNKYAENTSVFGKNIQFSPIYP